MGKFEPISEEFCAAIKELVIKEIDKRFKKDKAEDNCYKYEVQIHDRTTHVLMTEAEVEESFRLSVDMLEEMKNINNSGIDAKKLAKIREEIDSTYDSDHEAMKMMGTWKKFSSDRLVELMDEADKLRLVGGAYAMFVANPYLISALFSVFERLVDNFDDDNIYFNSSYFLTRAIMTMHGDESKNEE